MFSFCPVRLSGPVCPDQPCPASFGFLFAQMGPMVIALLLEDSLHATSPTAETPP